MGPRLSSPEEKLSPDAQQQVGHERKDFLSPACRVGEHTKKLLLEANFTIEEIDHLLEKKIIF
jgi:predicted deacetylase